MHQSNGGEVLYSVITTPELGARRRSYALRLRLGCAHDFEQLRFFAVDLAQLRLQGLYTLPLRVDGQLVRASNGDGGSA